MIQKTNTSYLELHTHASRYKNSRVLYAYLKKTRYVPRESHGNVETVIQLVSHFVQSVASDGRGSCDSLPHFWQRLRHFSLLCSPTIRCRMELSLATSAAICTTRHHWPTHYRSISGEIGLSGGSKQPYGSDVATQLVGILSHQLSGILRRLFLEAVTHDSLGALIFVGCVGRKSVHGPQLHHAQRVGQDSCLCKCDLTSRVSCTRRKWILESVVPCEIVREIGVSRLLQTLYSLTAEHTNSSAVG
jgi:hypothetical protein